MEALRVVINIIFILVCVALTVLVLMQEGKSAGLGSISGAAETYWGRNKGRGGVWPISTWCFSCA